jgi:putative NIF3 family GTP cyclohydrolase 1 type 2
MAEQRTIRDVIDTILSAIPRSPFPDTVDTVKAGDPSQPVSGIVTTFLATLEVIEHAAAAGANLIITHEPTFYTHLDDTDWLQGDAVYAAKAQLLADYGIVVWRFHDHWHAHAPDGIFTGVVKALGWEDNIVSPDPWLASAAGQGKLRMTGMAWAADPQRSTLCVIPQTRLDELARLLKERLAISSVRVAGSPELPCQRVMLLPGSPPGKLQITALSRDDVDVLVTGEINEWETCEYVRDANRAGRPRGLIVLGHAVSEEAGMGWLAEWLRERLPGVSVRHVPAGEPLRAL